MLDVKNLSRRYGEFVAVDDVSFTTKQGGIVGLLGHNGAGKTTIMKMLSGYLEPDSGHIIIDGFDLARAPKAVQQRLGYLPENLPVYPEMTVADYLDYAASLKGLDGTEKTSEIRRAIKATDIQAKLLSPIATLSRGLKQRVGVAQALLGRPKLLILDEPTNGLDPTQTDHMRHLIRDIAKHSTVILSTHIMQEVDALCDHVLILSGGKLVVNERLEDLRQSHYLLVNTSMAPKEAAKRIGTLDGVEEMDVRSQLEANLGETHQYRLKLNEQQVSSRTAARVAQAVITGGAELYSLQPEQRDLETLFREVSQAPATRLAKVTPEEEGLTHAA